MHSRLLNCAADCISHIKLSLTKFLHQCIDVLLCCPPSPPPSCSIVDHLVRKTSPLPGLHHHEILLISPNALLIPLLPLHLQFRGIKINFSLRVTLFYIQILHGGKKHSNTQNLHLNTTMFAPVGICKCWSPATRPLNRTCYLRSLALCTW